MIARFTASPSLPSTPRATAEGRRHRIRYGGLIGVYRGGTDGVGFKLVGPCLDAGASFDKRFERLAVVGQHAVAEHCAVVVGKRLAHEAGRGQLQPT